MTWERVTTMDQRVRFVSEYIDGYFGVREICRQFNISSKTGYKWIARYKEYGPRGLEDRCQRIIYSIFNHLNNHWRDRLLKEFNQFKINGERCSL